MIQAFEEKQAQDTKLWMEDQYNQFIRQWMFDLNEEEQQAWLWNSMVAMKKIIMRRKQWSPSA